MPEVFDIDDVVDVILEPGTEDEMKFRGVVEGVRMCGTRKYYVASNAFDGWLSPTTMKLFKRAEDLEEAEVVEDMTCWHTSTMRER